MERVRITDPARRFDMYPFELSGGMRQRIVIATALVLRPALLIADEPTTALDVTVQAEVLRTFRAVVEHTGTSLVLVTHDLGVVAGACDDVAVMYAGRIVERAATGATCSAARRTPTREPCSPAARGSTTRRWRGCAPSRASRRRSPAATRAAARSRRAALSRRPRCRSRAPRRCWSARDPDGALRRVACHLDAPA